MDIIKETDGKVLVVRVDTYNHKLSHIQELYKEAKKDFPTLEEKDVKVVLYGGKSYAKSYGLEFEIPKGHSIPESYTKIAYLEDTLS